MTEKTRNTIQLLWPFILAAVTIASAWGASRAETNALADEVERIDHQGSASLADVRVQVAESRAQFNAILQRLDRIERKLDQ